MTDAKTKPAKCEVSAVLWFLTAKHYGQLSLNKKLVITNCKTE